MVQELKASVISIADLYLDPNNPRFVGDDWNYIAEEEIDSARRQGEARDRLVKYFDVDKLRANMEVNGYLPIDRVIVREFKPEKYVVLEGNRRICAAKLIAEAYQSSFLDSEEYRNSFLKIPCLLYTGDDRDAAWIFQGLRHITGVIEWSAFSKAKLLVEQMEKQNISLSLVGKRFGITPYGAGQWVRGYKAFIQASGSPQ